MDEILPPVLFTVVKSAELHRYWPFLDRGCRDICRKVKPDWRPEDLYGALRAEAAVAVIVTRAERMLGFIVWHRQERTWSRTLDVFVWAVWTIPVRERIPADGWPEPFYRGWQYLSDLKRAIGGNKVITISRKGLQRKYGWKPIWLTYEIG